MEKYAGLTKYNGTNYRAWMIELKIAFNAAGIKSTLDGDSDKEKNAKGVFLIALMMTEDKRALLEDCESVKDAMAKIEVDNTRNSAPARSRLMGDNSTA